MPKANQHKPCPPEDELRPHLEHYYHLGLNDEKIANYCLEHFDKDVYGLSISSVKRYRKKWNLLKTRQQKHTIASISDSVDKIKKRFPNRGAGSITSALRLEENIRVPRDTVLAYLKQVEPAAVAARKHKKFVRRRFWAAGIHDIWAIDQHDKMKRFGLYLHVGLDPFSGLILWCKIWWTNHNPRLITSFYIEAARRLKAVPLITQSDPGTENFGVANAHTTIRQRLDPSLAGTLQHRWMREHQNIKPEIHWSILRKDWAPGFEDILEQGVENGWYDINILMEKHLFRWLAIPWLQRELDAWVRQRNTTPRRADKHKILPHGIPELINEKPRHFNSEDFKIPVSEDLLDEVENIWAPRDHAVFELVPPAFSHRVNQCYAAIGQPVLTSDTFWDIYLDLLRELRPTLQDPTFQEMLMEHAPIEEAAKAEEIGLLAGQQDLRPGPAMIGHQALGMAADNAAEAGSIYGDFTDTEDDEGDLVEEEDEGLL
ncbi:hypothetical protein BV25DRAFT_1922583 [Artomyces pyxidatus]|uniref:Uncharacterized protein n=1 Tax=Artomyces pyxidatus TaxID=48021 RepID=A0ACB8SFU4_9AGAM|nr:hypothetical protein BV25DRAFT_1922583 [Artomyces pyxidatus]